MQLVIMAKQMPVLNTGQNIVILRILESPDQVGIPRMTICENPKIQLFVRLTNPTVDFYPVYFYAGIMAKFLYPSSSGLSRKAGSKRIEGGYTYAKTFAKCILVVLGSAALTALIGVAALNLATTPNIASAQIPGDLSDYFSQIGKTSKPSKSFGEILETGPVASDSGFLTLNSSTSSATATSAPVATVSSSPKSIFLKNSTYTIAVLGDSMVDTLGPGVPHLANELRIRFPGVKFTVLNYGVGASNIEHGIERLTNSYTYLNEAKTSLLSQNPDIVVVESFAYNHWDNTQSDLNRHWLDISKIINIIKTNSTNAKIILAATIGPYCPTYTDGSANLPPERKYVECETVKAYLQNIVNYAGSQKFPLADAYHASLTGRDGNPKYINQGDHIHPSDSGKQLFANKVANAFAALEVKQ